MSHINNATRDPTGELSGRAARRFAGMRSEQHVTAVSITLAHEQLGNWMPMLIVV